MGSLSNFAENAMLNHIFKVTAYSKPTVWLALSTADPLETGAGIAEPASNYARKAIGAFAAASSRATSNSADVVFDEAAGSWGTITHYAIFDAETSGNMLAHGQFTVQKAVTTGNTLKVLAGDLDVSITAGGATDYLANKMLDHVLGTTTYTPATNLYIGLSTSTTTDAGEATEKSGSAYARVQCNLWTTSSAGALDNFATVTFPTATGEWGTLTHAFVADSATSGSANILTHGALGSPQAITTNDALEFSAGTYDITLD